jgi:integrative and conjugative element protein (TIGR02256 family)
METELLVDRAAWDRAVAAARRSIGRETGGLLLGWRHATGVYITDVIEVADAAAHRTGYRRRHALAQPLLEQALDDLPDGSPVGYVGEWHTHPAHQGPSWVDRFELRRISRRSVGMIALLVYAFDAHTDDWLPAGLCATRGRITRTVVQVVDSQHGDRK